MNPIERRIRKHHNADMDAGALEWRLDYMARQARHPKIRREALMAAAPLLAAPFVGAALAKTERADD